MIAVFQGRHVFLSRQPSKSLAGNDTEKDAQAKGKRAD